MKRKLFSMIIIITILVLIINVFTKSSYLTEIISFSVNLFVKNIFPSLFPMFIIGGILTELDIPLVLGNIFRKPMKFIFKAKGESAFVFFMSMITGFPSSAKYIYDLMEKKLLTRKEAEKTLMFTFFSNPLFIVNTVGIMFFGSITIGFYLLICHILGNIIVGVIFRNYNSSCFIYDNNHFNSLSHLNQKINNTNIIKVVLKSIRSSLDALVNVFGIITFFLIILGPIFKEGNNVFSIFAIGITEMTSGLKYLEISSIPLEFSILIAMFFISFGGFSVHFQILSILNEKKVKYLPFLIARIIHAIISVMLVLFCFQVGMLS